MNTVKNVSTSDYSRPSEMSAKDIVAACRQERLDTELRRCAKYLPLIYQSSQRTA